MKTEVLIKSTIAIVSALFRFQGNCSLSGEMAVLNYKSLEEMEHLLNTVSLGREREGNATFCFGGIVLRPFSLTMAKFYFVTLDIHFRGRLTAFYSENYSNLIKIVKL